VIEPALISAMLALAPAVVVRLTPLLPDPDPDIDDVWVISTVRKSLAVASLDDATKPGPLDPEIVAFERM
jgi:hypothetical protein